MQNIIIAFNYVSLIFKQNQLDNSIICIIEPTVYLCLSARQLDLAHFRRFRVLLYRNPFTTIELHLRIEIHVRNIRRQTEGRLLEWNYWEP